MVHTVPWLLGVTVLVSLAKVMEAGDPFKLDFSCQSEFPDYNADAMEVLREDCKLKMGNPLKRPCVEACILHDTGLLGTVFNETKMGVEVFVKNKGTFVTTELEDLFNDNLDLAEAVQAKVEEQCGETMKKVVQADKKNCENWDDILTCVQKAGCEAKIERIQDIFPDFRCHPGYKRGPAREDHELCLRDVENPFNKKCYKACMLQRFKIFEYEKRDDKDPVPKLGGSKNDLEYGSLAGELMWRFKTKSHNLTTKFATNIHKKCKDIFRKTIIEEKKSCEEWDPVYDCIKDVVGCCSKQGGFPTKCAA